jgi:ABC-type dipeptide/oligopeptide/nickel transport system permease subunit
MNATSFMGLYIIISILSTCTSIVLAILKVFKIITIPWLFVATPVCAIIVLGIAFVLIGYNIYDICSKHNRKKYAVKNIYD